MPADLIEKKTARAEAPVLDVIKARWSPRAFDPDKPVSDETLRLLLEAARWAPSSYNEQPWRYIIGRNKDDAWKNIFDCLVSFNQQWCKNAPVLLLTAAKNDFSRDGSENSHNFHDVGQASAIMALQAANEGVFIHQMAGFSPVKARAVFKIPEGFSPCSCIAIGYHGDPSSLPHDLQSGENAERTRMPLDEWVFQNEWGQPLKI